ncbi:hypothetical protein GCM10010401_19280 [Rarobacter faecitabidus]|uniref:Membrane protein DedA with SNARE-associated domain n=1 Tax=Rarobacter faecitabidus TaxID=13243 RepID=A0A542ZUT9_RARFA|nr:DedA family protein [Rarobacter faecitabidus]TQL64135.1 membrane protein DedA with SNARE-associated domain [Rarobacter faecitabidus]
MSQAEWLAAASRTSTAEYGGFIGWFLDTMSSLGEVGVGVAVLAETFFPPIPSEIVLPTAGYLAHDGRMSLWLAWLLATLGGLIGSWGWYAIGAALGRDRTRRIFGKVPLLEFEDFDKAEAFFARWGTTAILVGRCVPIVRSLISIPAGIERMRLWQFTLYTSLGTAIWNAIWIGLGFALGPAVQPVLDRWHSALSNIVIAIVLGAVLWFVVKRVVKRRRASAEG